MNPATFFSKITYGTNGAGIAVWVNSFNGSLFTIQYSLFTDGTWGEVISFYRNDLFAYNFDLEISANGNAYLVWMNYDYANSGIMIQGSVLDIDGSNGIFFQLWTLSTAEANAFPTVAINSSGESIYGVASWMSFDGSENVIQALISEFSILQPPINLSVVQQVNNFGVLNEYYNVLSWEPSLSGGAARYLVFRNGVFLTTLMGDQLQYTDQSRFVGETVTYAVVAMDAQGCESEEALITFSN